MEKYDGKPINVNIESVFYRHNYETDFKGEEISDQTNIKKINKMFTELELDIRCQEEDISNTTNILNPDNILIVSFGKTSTQAHKLSGEYVYCGLFDGFFEINDEQIDIFLNNLLEAIDEDGDIKVIIFTNLFDTLVVKNTYLNEYTSDITQLINIKNIFKNYYCIIEAQTQDTLLQNGYELICARKLYDMFGDTPVTLYVCIFEEDGITFAKCEKINGNITLNNQDRIDFSEINKSDDELFAILQGNFELVHFRQFFEKYKSFIKLIGKFKTHSYLIILQTGRLRRMFENYHKITEQYEQIKEEYEKITKEYIDETDKYEEKTKEYEEQTDEYEKQKEIHEKQKEYENNKGLNTPKYRILVEMFKNITDKYDELTEEYENSTKTHDQITEQYKKDTSMFEQYTQTYKEVMSGHNITPLLSQ